MGNRGDRTEWMRHIGDLLERAAGSTGQSPLVSVEIGVAMGEASAYFLRRFPVLRHVMVDPWRFMPEYMKWLGLRSNKMLSTQAAWDAVYEAAVRATDFAADRRMILRMKSLDAAPTIADRSVCLIFIDGEHTFEAVTADCGAWWPKVAPGGILAGDDWCIARVSRAARAWAASAGLQTTLVGKVWHVEKLK